MKYLIIYLFAVFTCACQSEKTDKLKIKFRVDISEIQSKIDDINTLGLSGYRPHLLPRKVISLHDEGNGIYSLEMSFDKKFIGDTIIFWYSHDLINLENSPYGQTGFRKVIIGPDDKELPLVKWGDIPGPASVKISSPRMVVRQSDTEAEDQILAQPFVGITTNGRLKEGLYSIKETRVNTAPINNSVNNFLQSLTLEQQERCTFSIDAKEWQRWSNTDFYRRKGISLKDLDENQKILALEILKSSLSPKGFEKTQNIMKMENYLARLTDHEDRYGKDYYWLSFMGLPSPSEPWGWQIEGHHMVINYFVLGDQIVMTPTFMGSEPTYIESGEDRGIKTFDREEKLGLQLYRSLNDDQRLNATLHDKKDLNFIQTQSYSDNRIIPYTGIQANELTLDQKNLLIELIQEYVETMKEGHADIKMDEVKLHLNETYFSWIGMDTENSAFYYRIYSPVILIEFDHQSPVSLEGDKPSRNHIHTVVRTPNGNDYGKDLLRQHLNRHHH